MSEASNSFPDFSESQVNAFYQRLDESVAARNVRDRAYYFNMLQGVPALDPVLAVVNRRRGELPMDRLPREGWLVNAFVAPGNSGVVGIYRYPEGGLQVTNENDGRPDGSVSVGFQLEPGRSTAFAYENPNYPLKLTDPRDREARSAYMPLRFADSEAKPSPSSRPFAKIITLDESGGRLLVPSHISAIGGISLELNWEDMNDPLNRDANDVEINRVTGSDEELAGVLIQLAFGMGLENEDVRTLINTTSQELRKI